MGHAHHAHPSIISSKQLASCRRTPGSAIALEAVLASEMVIVIGHPTAKFRNFSVFQFMPTFICCRDTVSSTGAGKTISANA